jgi:DNA invertase Pin-like site-specific DNA recombinase
MAENKNTTTGGSRNRLWSERHPKAILSDIEVEEVRDLYDEGGTSYSRLAKKFGVSKHCIRDIIQFRRRALSVIQLEIMHRY